MIDGGMSESVMSGEDGVGLDLDLPRGIEQPRDDEHRGGRAHLAEDLAVRAADRLPVRRVGDVDARADDVLRPAAELASAATMISRQRFACSYGSGESQPIGAVPPT